ncbi:MAG TPA: transcription-repair coupling factor [Victivallales bacterium]|nr:transcription-repair coupling factor [Victivallales bacterium]
MPSTFINVDDDLISVILLRLLNSLNSSRIFLIFPNTAIAEQQFIYAQNICRDFPILRNDLYFLPELLSNEKRLSADLLLRFSTTVEVFLSSSPAVFFTSCLGIMSYIPASFHKKKSFFLFRGMKISMIELYSKLVEMNYSDETETKVPGEFTRRGGIVDLFSTSEKYPVRIEFFGDEIENMRFFDPVNQLSFKKIDKYKISPLLEITENIDDEGKISISDYLKEGDRIGIFFPGKCREHLRRFAGEDYELSFSKKYLASNNSLLIMDFIESEGKTGEDFSEYLLSPFVIGKYSLSTEDLTEKIYKSLHGLLTEDYKILIGTKDNEGQMHILNMLKERKLMQDSIAVKNSFLPFSFKIPELKIAYFSEDVFLALPFKRVPRLSEEINYRKKKILLGEFFSDFDEGDYVVHNDYGIGIFRGFVKKISNGIEKEFLLVEFDDDVMIYTEIYQSNLINKYSGAGKIQPSLSTIGKKNWTRSKILAKKGVRDFAAQMLRIQALRMEKTGLRFKKNRMEEKIFEKKFPFTETIDQRIATDEIFKDMESPYPMDRLLCGDAGYGKTEVAMRAAFKSVMSGKQVVVLVPTTVLAQQHYYTFIERFSDYPVIIEMLSRFRTVQEQKLILEKLANGSIDIIIGTHRLIQKDVIFKDLGLLIIDEEQRFGVEHKEILKKLREKVDILSMSATPIPRTLYMAMSGIRDLSTISTPPSERLPVLTYISKFDEKLIKNAINFELERGGQVFFLHNRVKTIRTVADFLAELSPPGTQIGIVHGQMDEDELEEEMLYFLQGKTQILCCTTIIESGIDVPNANTLIVDHAEFFGLSELYQLRGRVGRSGKQGYAYFLLPPHTHLTSNARDRIAALKKHSELGAGFRIALRDLEIRGAGNIIGTEQSGYINAVGFELYCHYLRMASAELRGEKLLNFESCDINIDFFVFGKVIGKKISEKLEAYIPDTYIDSEKLRCRFYRKIAMVESIAKIDEIRAEMRDRFGKIPQEVENLLSFQSLKVSLLKTGFNKMMVQNDSLEICEVQSGKYLLIGNRQPKLISKTPIAKVAEIKKLLESYKKI